MWIDYFDRIIVISLSDEEGKSVSKVRRDKLAQELAAYGLDWKAYYYYGCRMPDGAAGLRLTMQEVFEYCIKQGFKRVLILEDDATFLVDPNETMEKCIAHLQQMDWDLFYMGVNMHERFERFVSPNLLPVKHGYSTHAVAYTAEAMRLVLETMKTCPNPMDVLLDEFIQSRGKSFCSYPLLATQRNGWSDIENKEVDYGFIANRFKIFTQHLL